MRVSILRSACAGLVLFSSTAVADGMSVGSEGMKGMRADGHAPFGVMADHMHKRGEWMLSYRYMHMDMEGNRIGDDEVSPAFIATSVANPFFGTPGQPPTLRVVPTKMTMDMHMFGGMYAPTDWLTLMLMSGYVEKEMDHLTFAGGAGTTVRGAFTTKSDGLGDTRLTGMFNLYHDAVHRAHLNVGVSMPTGSTDEQARVLTPMGATPELRMPYAMQLGSGTWDLLPGVSYAGRMHAFGWGAQYGATLRTGRDNGYQWGDRHQLTGWLSWQPVMAVSFSARVLYETMGTIDGRDARIMAPVQTADPDNYGGDTVSMLFGVNLVGQRGFWLGKRIAVEAGFPVMQDLNGPQMETDFTVTTGVQIPF